MKKVILGLAVVATMGMTSCGGSEMCECTELGLDLMEQMKAADGDADKIKEIQEANKDAQKNCEEVAKAWEKEMKDKYESQEEAQKAFSDECPAFKEVMDQMGK